LMRFSPGTNQRGNDDKKNLSTKEERGQAALPNLETFNLEESAGGVCVLESSRSCNGGKPERSSRCQ
jgi:hypothetical protein